MFKIQVNTSEMDVFGISVTWLNEAIPDGLVQLQRFNVLDRRWRDNNVGDTVNWKRGGGLLCYVKKEIQASDTKFAHLNCSTKDLEMQWIAVNLKNTRPIVILNVYRPPQGDSQQACDKINDALAQANLKNNTEIYLMGDINIDLKDKKSTSTKELMFMTGVNGLSPQITATTRFSCREGVCKESCIDHTFTNSMIMADSGTLDLNLSDHLAVYVRRKKARVFSKKVTFTGRSYRFFVKEDFQEALINADWERFYSSEDSALCWDILQNTIETILDQSCPLRTFRVKEVREPWITAELLEEIKDKDNYLRLAKLSGLEDDWTLAKRERNRVGKLVKNAKAEFVKEQQREFKSDPKKFWKAISTIVPSKKQVQGKISLTREDNGDQSEIEEGEVADYVNGFFSSIGPKLASKMKEPWRFFGTRNPIDCPEVRTDFEEVVDLCKEINVSKSSGFQNISSKIFKNVFMVLIPQLVYLFNLSFESRVFPDSWKSATVIPLFKGGDRSQVGNFRPISLLLLPGKLIEKIAHTRITFFLENNDILTDRQGGFRKGFSTTSSVADLTDSLFTAINESELSLAVFADLKKAFDTVDHKVLCKKLENYGLRGKLLDWCVNYLQN